MTMNDFDIVLTLEDVIQFYKTLQARAEKNLKNAEKRHDKQAVYNIQRKILIYKYTLAILKERG